VTVTPPCEPGDMRIDCDECQMQGTSTCGDCVVSFVVSRSPGDALVIDVEAERAVRRLVMVGLVPGLRHEPRATGTEAGRS